MIRLFQKFRILPKFQRYREILKDLMFRLYQKFQILPRFQRFH
jgi:hypothetical protein